MIFEPDVVFAEDSDFDPADRIDMEALRNVDEVDYDAMWDDDYDIPDDYVPQA